MGTVCAKAGGKESTTHRGTGRDPKRLGHRRGAAVVRAHSRQVNGPEHEGHTQHA